MLTRVSDMLVSETVRSLPDRMRRSFRSRDGGLPSRK